MHLWHSFLFLRFALQIFLLQKTIFPQFCIFCFYYYICWQQSFKFIYLCIYILTYSSMMLHAATPCMHSHIHSFMHMSIYIQQHALLFSSSSSKLHYIVHTDFLFFFFWNVFKQNHINYDNTLLWWKKQKTVKSWQTKKKRCIIVPCLLLLHIRKRIDVQPGAGEYICYILW